MLLGKLSFKQYRLNKVTAQFRPKPRNFFQKFLLVKLTFNRRQYCQADQAMPLFKFNCLCLSKTKIPEVFRETVPVYVEITLAIA